MTETASHEDSLLQDLTDPQRQAVTHVDGPLLVVAAAGSGKTRVITRRVGYLLKLGIDPRTILAITFTNKAAGEMKQRISAISTKPIRDWGRLDQPWPIICTFHSLCLRILRHYSTQIGLAPNFSVFDSSDQNRVVKEAMKLLEISTENYTPGAVHAAISKAKNELVDAAQYASSVTGFFGGIVARVYTKYQQLLATNNALDFDDLQLLAVRALREHPTILAELQERFKYILVDEYQDTNHAQYVLIHALAMKHHNLCVVGDPDQSIYAWRGADISNILEFENDYPDAAVVRLEQNYRSTKVILAIAEKLISFNRRRKEKRLWTENDEGERPRVLLCLDEHDEARIVAEELQRVQKQGVEWGKMAIFYRMNSLSRVMEDALRRKGIPYQIARGVEFYSRKEIKDVLAYLRTIANPNDEVSLSRIINVPTRGIGDSSVKLMQARALGSGQGLWESMADPSQVPGLSSRAINSIGTFIRLIESFRKIREGASSVRALMEEVVQRSGLEAALKKEDPNKENELANVAELISSAAEYDKENSEGSLDDYLARVSLVSDADHMEGAGGAVTLMTLHAAKGLEFPVVAMIGLEEGCLPHARVKEDAEQLEEERRLCFVGITRAQQRLFLSKAARRMIRGSYTNTAPSQFLMEMPKEMLEIVDRGDSQFGQPDSGYDAPEIDFEFSVGQLVKHHIFGTGKIIDLSKSGANTRAVVDFPRAGRKTLVLEYANLKPA